MSGAGETGRRPGRRRMGLGWTLLRTAVLSMGAVWLMLAYVGQVFRISGASMAPVLRSGERVLVNKIGPRFRGVERGEVVVFRNPSNPAVAMVKRIVALPGDTVRFQGDAISVVPADADGSRAAVPCAAALEGPGSVSMTVEAGHYFALGDNRSESRDSRHWGALPSEAVIGTVLARVFPPDRMAFLIP